MTVSLVNQLRARPRTIALGASDAPSITLRVQVPEIWDAVRIEAPVDEPVASVKARALEALLPAEEFPDEFVMKLHGAEIFDEQASVSAVGARDGSTFLLTRRRKRPIR
jgi:hypothetical protein